MQDRFRVTQPQAIIRHKSPQLHAKLTGAPVMCQIGFGARDLCSSGKHVAYIHSRIFHPSLRPAVALSDL